MHGAEVLIPISFFVMTGLVFIARSEIGKAFAHAIRAKAGGPAEEVAADIEELRAGLEEVRRQLSETQERLDFAERLLAQQRAPEQLRKG